MTNIRLRIEDAIPKVGFGSVDTNLFAGSTITGNRGSCSTPVAYRMAPVIPAKFETI